jgi:two-component system OmpR family response regulator
MKRILYLEDDERLAKIVVEYLSHFYNIDHVSLIGDLQISLQSTSYDLAILDRNIHGVDIGLSAIDSIHKKDNSISVLVTSSYSTVDDKIEGLTLGADDYLEKPFDVRELETRVSVLLRRKLPPFIELNGVRFDMKNRQIHYDGKMILLSQKENEILFYLLEHSNKLFTAQELIYALYAHPDEILPNTITVTIGKIRKKLPVEIIKTFKTRGYMIELT